ncbi:hypothetical protein [Qipengyuania sp. 902]|uniref:hypothetical protein n=1 Tax=Qipengyuania sp. 902 TaxID=3417565 RepID=UPI003EC05FD5
MHRIQIAILSRGERELHHVRLDTLDLGTALLVTDINLAEGSAELWEGERRLARLIKHGGPHATFWEVGCR